MSITADLHLARTTIENEQWKLALDHLLCAWRSKREPRVADLIDRVSERLPREPITGKTVKIRLAAWFEAAKTHDAVELGRLLSSTWPSRWQQVALAIEELGLFTDDPRIAKAVAELVATEPYDSSFSAEELLRPAISLLIRLRDIRAKAILEPLLTRPHSNLWSLREGPLIADFVRNLQAPEVLEPAEEAAVTLLEALFGTEIAAEHAAVKTEADFLAEIYGSPNEDGPRAVYADWLTEHGDPRGELITLQLTPHPTAAMKKREAVLLRKHGVAWAGLFDALFAKQGRVFTRGFLSGGAFAEAWYPDSTELDAREWAVIEEVRVSPMLMRQMPERVLAAPWISTIRRLSGLSDATAAELATRGRATQLEGLDIELEPFRPDLVAGRHRIASAFPNATTLGLQGPWDSMIAFVSGPLPPRVERLIVHDASFPLAIVARAIEENTPTVMVLEGRSTKAQKDGEWRFELRRDSNGRFTRLRAAPHHLQLELPQPDHLTNLLASLPHLTELVVSTEGGCRWTRRELAFVESALGRVTNLRTIDVPWPREA